MKKWLMLFIAILAIGATLVVGVIHPRLASGNKDVSSQPVLVMAGIDSLTNGPLHAATKSRYLDDFIPRLKKRFGDGGPGYIPFDSRYFSQDGGRLWYSRHLKEINDLPPAAPPALYSLDMKGLYTYHGVRDRVIIRLNDSWKHGKLFYLIHPDGGSFQVGYRGGPFKRVVTDGPRDLGVVPLPEHRGNRALVIRRINGKVILFGGYFYNDRGVIVSRIGQGGDQLAWFAGLNHTMQEKWLAALKPNLFLFNGGMNDRRFLSASEYKTALTRYLDPFRRSGCRIVVIIPNAIFGDNRPLQAYSGVLKNYAKDYGTGLVSNRKALGATFQIAQKRGYMADHIHPNAAGSRLISRHMYRYLMSHEEYRSLLADNKWD